MISRSLQNKRVFGILTRFGENLLENEKLVCGATASGKTALVVLQLWFNYFATSLFKALGTAIRFQGAKDKGTSVDGAFLSDSLLV